MTNRNPEWEHLDTVRERVIQRLSGTAPIHEIHFAPITMQEIEVYVFYEQNNDLRQCDEKGITGAIKRVFQEELDRVGRGSEAGVKVRFEFDSHENVTKNFQGNYFLRLR